CACSSIDGTCPRSREYESSEASGTGTQVRSHDRLLAGDPVARSSRNTPEMRKKGSRLRLAKPFLVARQGPQALGLVGGYDTSVRRKKRKSPSRLIDEKIKELGDWRGKMLSRLRTLIKQADPGVVEEWKWRGVPVWSHDGLICTGETYKN